MEAKIIGSKIAAARKKMNISQAQLAERLFISPQAVGKWERGESVPDIITFNRLAEILGVDLNYFSENVLSEDTDVMPDEQMTTGLPVQQPVERPSVMPQKKLNWDMSRGNWTDADFSGLKGLDEKFSSSNMQRCKFIGSDLSGLLLKSNHIVHCDFSGSDISNSHIQNSHLASNQFKSSLLKETRFSGSHIQSCDFSDVDFTGATFKSCDFEKNPVDNATWNSTSFITSQISSIVFDGTMKDCYFENCAFSKVTFQNAILTNTFFKGRSLKRIRFIDCKADPITYAFLKSGNAVMTDITLLTS